MKVTIKQLKRIIREEYSRLLQEGELADRKYADANRPLSQEELESVFDQISIAIENKGSSDYVEETIADMWMKENSWVYEDHGRIYVTGPEKGRTMVKIVWDGYQTAGEEY